MERIKDGYQPKRSDLDVNNPPGSKKTERESNLKPCECPEGSLCGFFNKDNESCMYGEV